MCSKLLRVGRAMPWCAPCARRHRGRYVNGQVLADGVDSGPVAAAHRSCGLSVLIARYAMTANFSVLNFNGPASRVPAGPGLRLASWVSKLIWSLERVGLPEVPNRLTSPYAVVLAQRQR